MVHHAAALFFLRLEEFIEAASSLKIHLPGFYSIRDDTKSMSVTDC